jgi:hypothetical protein
MDGMSTTVKLLVSREGRNWIGLPEGHPGSCVGRSIAELMLEAQAILPYMLASPDGVPNRDIVVDCVFTEIPVELQEDVRQYHALTEQRRDLDRRLNALGARTVKKLRAAAGLTDDDSAAMLGISRQRANQLRNAS